MALNRDVFVGTDRHRIVEAIESAFDDVRAGGGPRLITIVAPTGHGKTRIVQEFYSRVARAQPEPMYWPPEMVEAPGELPLLRTRKFVSPVNPDVPEDATLSWLWWGLRCEQDSRGLPMRAVANGIGQLLGHAEAILARVAQRRSARRHAAKALGGLAGLFLPDVAGFLLSAKPMVADLARWGRSAAARRSDKRNTRATEEPQIRTIDSEADATKADEVFGYLRDVLSDDLPLVLVIDDAHWADSTTVELVDSVLRSRMPTLVVATAWPEELAQQVREDASVPLAQRRRFGSWLDANTGLLSITRIDLEPLGSEDLSALVTADGPETEPEVTAALVARAGGNPLVLRHVLELPKVRRSLDQDAYTIEPAEVEQLPEEIKAILGVRWQHFSLELQTALACASVVGVEFLTPFVIEPPSASRLFQDPEGWTRSIDADLREFAELALWEVACGAQSDLFTALELDQVRERIRLAAAEKTAESEFEKVDPRAQRVALQCHVEFATDLDELSRNERHETAWNALRLAGLEDDTGNPDAACHWARRASDLFSHASDDEESVSLALRARRDLGRYLTRARRFDEAITILHDVLVHLEAMDDLDDVLLARSAALTALGRALREAARVDEALVVLKQAELLDQTLGNPEAEFFDRLDIARCLERAGRHKDALTTYRGLLNDPAMPEDVYPYILRDCADCVDQMGDYSEAAELYAQVISVAEARDKERLALGTAFSLAWAHLNMGDPKTAAALGESALQRISATLGPESMEARSCRQVIAAAALFGGESSNLEKLVPPEVFDEVANLPPAHPDRIYMDAISTYLSVFPNFTNSPEAVSSLLEAQEELCAWYGPAHEDVQVLTGLASVALLNLEKFDAVIHLALPVLEEAKGTSTTTLTLAGTVAVAAGFAASSNHNERLDRWIAFVKEWSSQAQIADAAGLADFILAAAEIMLFHKIGDQSAARAALKRGKQAAMSLGRPWELTILSDAVVHVGWPEAIDVLKTRIKQMLEGGARPEAVLGERRALARDLFRRGRFEEAAAVEQVILTTVAENPAAVPHEWSWAERELAQTLSRLERFEEALSLLEMAWTRDLDSGQDGASGALRSARLAVELAPAEDEELIAELLALLAETLEYVQRYDIPRDELAQAIRKGQTRAAEIGRNSEARRFATRAVHLAYPDRDPA